MGVLTEILIASDADADDLAAATAPIERWLGLDAKGHNEVTLGTLWHVLDGGTAETADLETFAEFVCLTKASEEGPWVFRLPLGLVRSLSLLSDEQAGAAASGWCLADELQGLGHEGCYELLLRLRALAQQAEAEGKTLLMWISL